MIFNPVVSRATEESGGVWRAAFITVLSASDRLISANFFVCFLKGQTWEEWFPWIGGFITAPYESAIVTRVVASGGFPSESYDLSIQFSIASDGRIMASFSSTFQELDGGLCFLTCGGNYVYATDQIQEDGMYDTSLT